MNAILLVSETELGFENVSAVYPYDIIKTLINGDVELAELQLKSLCEVFLTERIITLVDVSDQLTAELVHH